MYLFKNFPSTAHAIIVISSLRMVTEYLRVETRMYFN